MKKILLFSIIVLSVVIFSGCEDDVVASNNPRLIFFAVEGETHLPVHIVVDSDTIATISETTAFDGEFPNLDDTTVVIVEVEKGAHSYEAFTYNKDGDVNFVENGPYFEGLSILGDIIADNYDYYIPLHFSK